VCLGYAERLRHQKEIAWLQVSLIGSLLFSKKGLPSLSEVTGTKTAARHQDPRELDLMLDMFAHQAKQLQKAA
jgi:hypothetical protein